MRERLYEWVIAMFNGEVRGQKCSYKDGVELISGLKSKLNVVVSTHNNNGALDDCIISIFGDSEEFKETVIEIHDDYTNIPEGNTDNNSNINVSEAMINRDVVDKIALGDVFKQARMKMIEVKIHMVRERKQKRKLRSRTFFLEINDKVSKLDNMLGIEMVKITNSSIFNPWYLTAYRAVSN